MLKLARYIEHEFDRNIIFFTQAYSRAASSLDFICYILEDTKLINLNKEEEKYVRKIKECYSQISILTEKITEEIQKYKEAYQEFLIDENYNN